MFQLNRSRALLLATLLIAVVLFVAASLRYTGFFSAGVFINLIDDNAFLGIAAIGMTFVILSGGIDLSVGSMIGVTSIASALLVERSHFHPATAAVIVLLGGALFGALQGLLIARFEIAPFLVTLAGMFFLRGAAYSMSLESVALTHPAYRSLGALRLPLGSASLPAPGTLFFVMLALGIYVARHTRFGRGVYAIGGNAQSAVLMGLQSKQILILIYVLSGTCAALAGLTYAVYTSSGSATAAMGLELDVIAAVVIGGTLLSGGQGSIIGTFIGVIILGAIQTIITFEGTLSSWWTRIVIGLLLFFFVSLQKALGAWWQNRVSHSPPPKVVVRNNPKLGGPDMTAIGLSISLILFSGGVHAGTPVAQCPSGFESGARLGDSGILQLTGTHLIVGQEDGDDVPDPAPPYVNAKGEVEIYGSSLSFLRYKSWKDFDEGGCYERVPLNLVQDNLVGYPDLYSRPWDARKFRVGRKDGSSFEVIVAGAMSRTGPRTFPRWPDENTNRRLFLYRQDSQNRWVRDVNPLVGKAEDKWIGHSYGGNFVQVGMTDQNVIRLGEPGEIAFFYEKVSDDTGNSPYKTEIFASKMRGFEILHGEAEVPIFKINEPPYPSLKRTVGGFLAEGPRPIEMTIAGQKFFIVAFSSGDFSTDSYFLNYVWSKNLLGPYKPVLTGDGTDLLDLGKEIKSTYRLSWLGRPSIFKTPKGDYEILFHAVRKDIRPGNDYTKWPTDLLGFYRSMFKAALRTSLNKNGEPVLELSASSRSTKCDSAAGMMTLTSSKGASACGF